MGVSLMWTVHQWPGFKLLVVVVYGTFSVLLMFVFMQACQCLLFPLSLSDCNYMADYSVTSA